MIFHERFFAHRGCGVLTCLTLATAGGWTHPPTTRNRDQNAARSSESMYLPFKGDLLRMQLRIQRIRCKLILQCGAFLLIA